MESNVNAVNVDQWELCKENVQPLKKGRNFSSLTSALHDHNEHQRSLLAQRQQFEEELRSYKGDDPLSVWSRYISWTEQSYPTGGKDSNLEQILHTCVSLFKDDKKYQNDPRYVQAWIKMANNYLDEPSGAFQFMHDQGIGAGLAIFYEAWSWELEQSGNAKKADAVLNRGLECYAAPIEQLHKYHKEFQTRIVRGTMEGTVEAMDTRPEEERTALGGLRGRGKHHKVGTQRIGHAKKDLKGFKGNQTEQPLSSNKRIEVFCDENARAPAVPEPTGEWETVPRRGVATKENVHEPSQWTSHRVPQRGFAMPQPASSSSIVVHVDADADQITTPRKPPQMTHSVLSARKPEKKPSAVQYINTFPAADDKTKVMYPKHLIYGGVSEMSLEELRAIRYKEKKREKLLLEEQKRIEQQKNELLRTKEALRQQQEELERERIIFQQKMEQERLLQEQKLIEQEKQQLIQQQILQQQLLQQKQEQEEQQQWILQEQQQQQKILEQQKLLEQQQKQTLLEQQQKQKLHEHQEQQKLIEQQILLEQQQQQKLLEQQQQKLLEQQQQQMLLEQQQKLQHKKFPEEQQTVAPASTNSSLRRDSDSGREFTITKQLNFEDTKPLPADLNNISQHHTSFTTTPSTNYSGMVASFSKSNQKTPSISQKITPQSALKTKTPPSGMMHKTPGSDSSVKRSFLQPTPKSQMRSFHDLQHVTPRHVNRGLTAPSPTVNTKEAIGCLFEMLSQPLNTDQFGWGVEDKELEREDEMFEAQFANTDDEFNMNHSKQGSFSNDSRGSSKPFTIYDETASDNKESEVKNNQFSIFEDQENKAPICIYEDKEPTIHSDPHGDEEVKMIEGVETMKLSLHLENRSTSQDCTFANPDFSSMARMVSTPFNSGEMPSFPVSHIKPSLVNSDDITQHDVEMETNAGVASASRVVTGDRESFDATEATVNNNSARQLSPIIEENSSDCSNSSQNKTRAPSNAHTSHQLQTTKHETSNIDVNVTRRRTSKSSSTSSTSSVHVDIPESSVYAEAQESTVYASDSTVYAPELSAYASVPETSVHTDVPNVSHLIEDVSNMSIGGVEEALEEVKEEAAEVFDASAMEDDYCEDELDPFSSDVVDKLIASLEQPLTSYPGFNYCQDTMPDVRTGITLYLGKYLFNVESKIGEGAFAKVYRAAMLDADDDTDLDGEGSKVILKVQQPACPWEFYICRQIAERIQGLDVMVDVRPSIMNIDAAFVYDDGSILLNEAHYNGTLLNLVNLRNKNKIQIDEKLVLYITIEILHIVDQLHRCGIIHGDIKPDNFLIRNSSAATLQTDPNTPSILGEKTSGLKLIDMGCSIDMNLFPPGTVFRSRNSTSCFECIEMTTGKPWTYQTDLYGIAGTIHTLIFGSYMKVFEESGEWKITSNVKRRYRANWKNFFRTLLNVPSCNEIPSLSELCRDMEQVYREQYSKFDR